MPTPTHAPTPHPCQRRLRIAVGQQDFKEALAAQRDAAALAARLPTRKQLLLAAVERLEGAPPQDRDAQLAAIQLVGSLGDPQSLPLLAARLGEGPPEAREAAEGAMWAVFCRAPNAAAAGALERGTQLMQGGRLEEAVRAFDECVAAAPGFAEVRAEQGMGGAGGWGVLAGGLRVQGPSRPLHKHTPHAPASPPPPTHPLPPPTNPLNTGVQQARHLLLPAEKV